MGNKKGNISVTLLTALVFIFSTILIVSTLYNNMSKKQFTHRNEHLETQDIKNQLLVVGSDICYKLNDNRISFDKDTIFIEIKDSFNNESFVISKDGNTIVLTLITTNNISYYRNIVLENSTYTLSDTIRK